MPLRTIPGPEAVDNLRRNRFADWPTRDDAGGNRIEPLCQPAFAPSFKLEPSDKIFAIGSCFARHVERALAIRGLDVVTSRTPIGSRGEAFFAQFGSGIFNNYGVPSILNELEWALCPERPFVSEDNIFEVAPGRYVDIHLPFSIKAAPLELVLERRRALHDVVRKVTACKVVIMTLGLSEVWFDTASGNYINHAVPRSLVARFPDRFQVHVLTYQETHACLQKIIALLQRTCMPEQRILLTVSPVPLAATHTGDDVLVTNCYSKSVLRVAAEEVAREHPHIDYFPSYESVTLSERAQAWTDDLRHVHDPVVNLNVERMIAAYQTDERPEVTPELIAAALSEAQDELDAHDVYAAMRHLEPLKDHLHRDAAAAVLYADVCLRLGRLADARAALQQAPGEDGGWRRALLEATALLRDNEPAQAVTLLERLSETEPKRGPVWQRLTETYMELQRWDDAIVAAKHWSEAVKRTGEPHRYVAEIFRAQRLMDQADAAYRTAMEQEVVSNRIVFDYVEFLIEQRRLKDAGAVLALAIPENRVQRERFERLKVLVPHAAPAINEREAIQRVVQDKATTAPPPTAPVPDVAANDKTVLAQAQGMMREERYEDAVAAVRPILGGASRPAACRLMGLAYLKLGRPAEAEAALSALLDLRDDPNVRGHLGSALAMQGKNEAAIEAMEIAARLEPQNPHWATRLGGLLLSLDRDGEAGAVVDRALQDHPGDAKLRKLKQRLGDRASAQAADADEDVTSGAQ